MLPEQNRNKQKPFRRIIFRVETYPLAGILLCCLYFFLVSGRIVFNTPGNINLPPVKTSYWRCSGQIPNHRIYITKDKKIYLNIDEESSRIKVLNGVSKYFGVKFNQTELLNFEKAEYFGDDIYSFNLTKQNFKIEHQGIPFDNQNNQLAIWIEEIKANTYPSRYIIYADKDLDMSEVDKVIKVLQQNEIHRISFMMDWVG